MTSNTPDNPDLDGFYLIEVDDLGTRTVFDDRPLRLRAPFGRLIVMEWRAGKWIDVPNPPLQPSDSLASRGVSTPLDRAWAAVNVLGAPDSDMEGLASRLETIDGSFTMEAIKRHCKAAAQALRSAEARAKAGEEESAELTRALTGLTCGGSEFFIRKGDRYVADIGRCVDWVRRRDQSAAQRALTAMHERKCAEAKLLAAEAANAKLRETLIGTAASLAAAISLLERSPKTAAASNKMFDQMLVDYRRSLAEARAALAAPKEEDDV